MPGASSGPAPHSSSPSLLELRPPLPGDAVVEVLISKFPAIPDSHMAGSVEHRLPDVLL